MDKSIYMGLSAIVVFLVLILGLLGLKYFYVKPPDFSDKFKTELSSVPHNTIFVEDAKDFDPSKFIEQITIPQMPKLNITDVVSDPFVSMILNPKEFENRCGSCDNFYDPLRGYGPNCIRECPRKGKVDAITDCTTFKCYHN